MAIRDRIHHMVFEVTDLERARGFWGGTLGLQPAGEAPWIEDRPHTAFRTDDGQYVVLVRVDVVRPMAPKVHTGFTVSPEGFREVVARVREATGRRDVINNGRLGERPAGEVATYSTDPDGHRIQVTVWADEENYQVPAAHRGRIVAGRPEDFPLGSVTYVPAGRFFLVHLPQGLLALNEVCTHQRCRIGYEPGTYNFYCPCHERRFTREGDTVGHAFGFHLDTPPLHAYRVEIEDGQVVVDTDTSVARTDDEAPQWCPNPAPLGRR